MLLARLLERHGYTCSLARDAHEARLRLREQAFSLVLCDLNMPGESGLHLIELVRQEYPETAAVMVTALDDHRLGTVAIENGAYGYILKPFQSSEVLINVTNALRRRRLELETRAKSRQLEHAVMERTTALHQTIERLEFAEEEIRQSQEETIQRLALAAEFKDEETARHLQRMSRYCALLAKKIGLEERRCELIRIASPMHDIGKIGTPDQLLLKPGKFTPEEFDIIRRHADIGYRILSGSDSELLQLAASIAWTHHEKFDGTGYPRGLGGDAIPLEGRIAAIADVFDALTTRRVYKPAFPIDRSLEMMRERRGTHFDPAILDVFLGAMADVVAIKEQHPDL